MQALAARKQIYIWVFLTFKNVVSLKKKFPKQCEIKAKLDFPPPVFFRPEVIG